MLLGAIGISAGLVIVNAHVLTLDTNAPHATCLVAKGERIVAVGQTTPECLRYRTDATSPAQTAAASQDPRKEPPASGPEAMPVVDAGGATIVPGFNDAHVHLGLSMLFEHLIRLPAFGKEAHKATWLQLLRSKLPKVPGTGWIFVQTPELPVGLESGHELDIATNPTANGGHKSASAGRGKLSPDRGVDGRGGRKNRGRNRGAKLSPDRGANRGTKLSPDRGTDGGTLLELSRDGSHGRPLLVVTRHGGLLSSEGLRQAPPGFALPDGFVPGRRLAPFLQLLAQAIPLGEQRAAALAFFATARALGITSAQFMSEDFSRLFESLRKSGELTLRARFVPLPTTRPPELTPAPLWVRTEGVKYYHDDPAPISRRDLSHIVAKAMAERTQVVFHVLGRYALGKLLDVVERLVKNIGPGATSAALASYLRVDHADQLGAAEAARLAKLGMMVCINPPLVAEWSSVELGPAATLAAAGVGLCMGTDWVGRTIPRPLSPLENLKLAALHGGVGESERLPAAQALYAYTAGSAAAEGLASQKGKLIPGMLADFVLLDRDPTTVPPDHLPKIRVLATVVGGRIVYRAHAGHLAPSQ